jgi:hypothetical protein
MLYLRLLKGDSDHTVSNGSVDKEKIWEEAVVVPF